MMPHEIVEKFTSHLKSVLTRALCLALEMKQTNVQPEHLLWALGTEKGCVGAEILHKCHVKPDALRRLAGTAPERQSARLPRPERIENPSLSPAARRTLEKAVLSATHHAHAYVGTEHLLSGLLAVKDRRLETFFAREQVSQKAMDEHLNVVLRSVSKFPELARTMGEPTTGVRNLPEQREEGETDAEGDRQKTPALDYFGRDLTAAARGGHIDPLVGRDAELRRVTEILCRRTKNNPLLLGEPGVGKTAIVEGLALRITEGSVPSALQGRRVVALDLGLAVAGTMYRGEFEARLHQIIEEARAHPEVILFVDEVHTIVGAGSASGSIDAANMLKPALARGEIRCIGATTLAEYRKHVEPDAALERRFQPVMVAEPRPDEAVRILEGLAATYERFHGVAIEPAALRAAVDLAVRYLPDKRLPDKAIDLLDETASAVRIRTGGGSSADREREVARELQRLREAKQAAVAAERYEEALKLREEERERQEELARLRASAVPAAALPLTAEDVRQTVARLTRLPLAALEENARATLLFLERDLNARIAGQEAAVRQVAEAVQRASTGVGNPRRPWTSLLFVGPSGVGKTELARAAAEAVFGDPKALVRLDMSEFGESHSASKLLGSPAGYVGYRESTKLADQLRQRPASVVLFDELEKAHPDVQQLLLQILEEGELTDGAGSRMSFRHALVILTSNVGSERLEGTRLGFSAGAESGGSHLREDLRQALEERFRPELVNRLDYVCVFEPLTETALRAIAARQLDELRDRLAERGTVLLWEPSVVQAIAARAALSKLRAREIRTSIQSQIEPLLARHLLEHSGHESIHVAWKDNAFCLLTENATS
ncbi:ATP-dependent Clp protease ATP-binding subunit [Candidatus Uhrbacteria bacterium]|nr:ATP-dependent Clp protease ATP-binding subunit [Candidatus Uhrbacteria bacterium]